MSPYSISSPSLGRADATRATPTPIPVDDVSFLLGADGCEPVLGTERHLRPGALERGLERARRQRFEVRGLLRIPGLRLLLGQLAERLGVAVVHDLEGELSTARGHRARADRLERGGLARPRHRRPDRRQDTGDGLGLPVLFREKATDERGPGGTRRGVREALGRGLFSLARRARRERHVAEPRLGFGLLLCHRRSVQAARPRAGWWMAAAWLRRVAAPCRIADAIGTMPGALGPTRARARTGTPRSASSVANIARSSEVSSRSIAVRMIDSASSASASRRSSSWPWRDRRTNRSTLSIASASSG